MTLLLFSKTKTTERKIQHSISTPYLYLYWRDSAFPLVLQMLCPCSYLRSSPHLTLFPIHFQELTEEHCSSKLFFLWHCKFLILYCNISNIKHVQKHMTHKTQRGNQWIPTYITYLLSPSQNPSHCLRIMLQNSLLFLLPPQSSHRALQSTLITPLICSSPRTTQRSACSSLHLHFKLLEFLKMVY